MFLAKYLQFLAIANAVLIVLAWLFMKPLDLGYRSDNVT